FALGSSSVASADNSTALGGAIDLNGNGTIEPGEYTLASGGLSMALGSAAQATQNNATAIGGLAQASGVGATAIGSDAVASGSSSVAIGFGSIASLANSVSFGGNGTYRELVNIADPTTAHSAVNLEYFNAHAITHAFTGSIMTDITQLQNEVNAMSVAKASQGTSGEWHSSAADNDTSSHAAPGSNAGLPHANGGV